MKRSLRSLSMDSSSELTFIDPPHMFQVYDLNGEKYCQCGWQKDADNLCEMHPGFFFTKIYLGETPKTVDVPHVTLAPDLELPMQQILPESQLEPLDLK